MSKLLEDIKSSDLTNVAIFSGAGVDPDGLACALGMKCIVEKFGGSAQMFYRGTFNRPQNKTMKEILALNVRPDTSIKDDEEFSLIISVDGPAEICPIWPNFIIDHHKPGKPAKGAVDIREIGACSSIIWEYCRAAEIDFTTEQGSLLATALAIGILTDTNEFKDPKCSLLDFTAAGALLSAKDHKTFLAIQNWPKPSYYSDMYSLGWQRKIWEGTVLVTGLGAIPEGRSGIISDLAEKFGEHSGVNLAIVAAMVGNEIIMSVRSSNSSIDVNEFVKTFGAGGGKRGAGVAKIQLPEPLFSNVSDEDRSSVFESFFKVIVAKALEFAGDGARPADRQLVDKE
jgi:nanoRNase/pAp phosphatase (c-di-AMP/oligoRNAs hydrolase)